MKQLGIILLFVSIRLISSAQTSGHEIKASNKDIKIALTEIIGNWYAADSTAAMISFINTNNSFVDIKGIKHGVGNYIFRVYGDSMLVNGTAANWPPYDCTLRILNNKHLEIEFYQFFTKESTKVIYRRQSN